MHIFLLWLASAWVSVRVARRQGYPALPFALFTLLFGPGGCLVTALLTRKKIAVPGPIRDAARSRLRSWQLDYQAIRLGLLLGPLASLHLFLVFTRPCICTFVTLFEGMSLKLPWPTQVVMWLSTLAHLQLLGTMECLLFAGFYLLLRRFFVDVHRAEFLYALRITVSACQALESLPRHCRGRLGHWMAELKEDDEAVEMLAEEARRDVVRWLWLGVPTVGFLAGVALATTIIGALYLPLYQCIGSLG